jgi:hypothetical protein
MMRGTAGATFMVAGLACVTCLAVSAAGASAQARTVHAQGDEESGTVVVREITGADAEACSVAGAKALAFTADGERVPMRIQVKKITGDDGAPVKTVIVTGHDAATVAVEAAKTAQVHAAVAAAHADMHAADAHAADTHAADTSEKTQKFHVRRPSHASAVTVVEGEPAVFSVDGADHAVKCHIVVRSLKQDDR